MWIFLHTLGVHCMFMLIHNKFEILPVSIYMENVWEFT